MYGVGLLYQMAYLYSTKSHDGGLYRYLQYFCTRKFCAKKSQKKSASVRLTVDLQQAFKNVDRCDTLLVAV